MTGHESRTTRRGRDPHPTAGLLCALIGRDAFFQVEAARHHPNEFLVLVGDSAKARKGSSFDHVTRLLAQADPAFNSRLTTGLSSGDYLTHPVICSRPGFPCSGRDLGSGHFG
jgi:hypothetical protein